MSDLDIDDYNEDCSAYIHYLSFEKTPEGRKYLQGLTDSLHKFQLKAFLTRLLRA